MLNAELDLNCMLDELSQRQRRIDVLAPLVNEDRERCKLLEKTLDEATRPPSIHVSRPSGPERAHRGYEYGGTFLRCFSEVEIYLALLRRLLVDFPEKRATIAAALHGRDRSFLAQRRQDLFQGKDEQWVKKNSKEVGAGWYADTNTNHPTKVKKMRCAIAAAGLRSGEDVKIFWRSNINR